MLARICSHVLFIRHSCGGVFRPRTLVILFSCCVLLFLAYHGPSWLFRLVEDDATQTQFVLRESNGNTVGPNPIPYGIHTVAPSTCGAMFSVEQFTDGLPYWCKEIKQMENSFLKERKCKKNLNHGTFAEALAAYASTDKVINLAANVDKGYLDMALNFYEFNIHQHNITNYLFMCIDKHACEVLKSYCIQAFLFTQAKGAETAQNYNSPIFNYKGNLKLVLIAEAIKLGYHILLADIDVVYLRNPFEHIDVKDETYDLQIQIDTWRSHKVRTANDLEYNSGFFFARSNPIMIKAFQDAAMSIKKKTKEHDQQIVNRIMHALENVKKIKIKHLDEKIFPAGKKYFGAYMWQKPRTFFYDDAAIDRGVVVVHNNWIVGVSAKVTRFKEHLMWVEDKDAYYSDPHRKYLMYSNPLIAGKKPDKETELSALRSAIGLASLTNRTLILPRFHCSKFTHLACCPMSFFHSIEKFDSAFAGMYRESTFLANPRTPYALRKSLSQPLFIKSPGTAEAPHDVDPVHLYTPALTSTHKSKPLLEWLSQFSQCQILNFHSLYHSAFPGFDDKVAQEKYIAELKKAGLDQATPK